MTFYTKKMRLLSFYLLIIFAYGTAYASTDTTDAATINITTIATAYVPADAHIIDEIIYIVGKQPILRSDKHSLALFLRIQMLLGTLPKKTFTTAELDSALLDFAVQQEWCDRFGIVVSDEHVLNTLEEMAYKRSQTLEQMRNDINALANNGYEVFYALHRQQLRFAQLQYAIARQNITVSEADIEQQYISLPEWRLDVSYLLLFEEYNTKENQALLLTALTENDTETLTQWQDEERIRFIEYKNTPLADMPSIVVDYIPEQVQQTKEFVTDSGYNVVHLISRTLDAPSLREYKLQQFVSTNRQLLVDFKNQLNATKNKPPQQKQTSVPVGVDVIDVQPHWYTLNALAPILADTLLRTSIGEVLGPIQVGNRWRIARVVATREATDKVVKQAIRQRIFASRFDDAFSKWLLDAKQQTYIEQVR